MDGTGEINGSANRPHTPQRTPSLSGLSLTEYSAKPSPPSECKNTRIRKSVPEEFLLPNGHPDVSYATPDNASFPYLYLA